jgi:dTDP-4-amino-4,6-dideoxygalactose transaminase
LKIKQNRPFLPPINEYQEMLPGIWERSWLTNSGPVEQSFEHLLEAYGFNYPIITSSGHVSLEIVLDLYDIQGEVITTPFTFASTTNAIVRRGLTPVFADIDRDSWNIDPRKVEALITEKTSAILAVHVFGQPCDVEALQRIADSNGLKLIYDAAHSFGVKLNGRDISTFGDSSVFSFHATKLFHSIEGGLICVGNNKEKEKVNEIKNFGLSDGIIKYAGCNGKMHEFSAAMGVVNLRYVAQVIQRRGELIKRYIENLKDVDGLSFQKSSIDADIKANYSYMPILLNSNKTKLNRDQTIDKLREYGVEARKYFAPLTSTSSYITNAIIDQNVALSVADSVMTLPLHFYLKDEEIDYVCDRLRSLI